MASLMKTRVLFKLMSPGQMTERYYSANVGFIGLGNMGNCMAANLLKKVGSLLSLTFILKGYL